MNLSDLEKLPKYDIGWRFSMSSFTDEVLDMVETKNGKYVRVEDVTKIILMDHGYMDIVGTKE